MQHRKNEACQNAREPRGHGAAQARIDEPAENHFLRNGGEKHRGKRADEPGRFEACRSFGIICHNVLRDRQQHKEQRNHGGKAQGAYGKGPDCARQERKKGDLTPIALLLRRKNGEKQKKRQRVGNERDERRVRKEIFRDLRARVRAGSTGKPGADAFDQSGGNAHEKLDADEKQRVAGRFPECGEDQLNAGLFGHVRQRLLLE